MKRPLLGLGLALSLVLTACRPDAIELGYHFDPGTQIAYRMEADADASWDIGGHGSGSYTVVFDVVETVRESSGGDVIVAVEMTPVNVEERGLPSPGAEQRSFALRMGPGGEVKEVLEVDGVEANALDPDELVFIGTYRPPLPEQPVGLGDTWDSEQQVQLESVFQQVLTTGHLQRLDRDANGRVAEIDYNGQGPLIWTTTLPQGEADLTGSAQTKTHAVFDIDRGSLRDATSSMQGTFEVRIVPGGDRPPIMGRLELALDLHVTRK
jgi:hypothetical protein